MVYRMKKIFLIMLICLGLCSITHKAQAMTDFSSGSVYINDNVTLENEKATIKWSGFSDRFTYDVELADNLQFTDAKLYSTNATELTIEQSAFGEHGGRFYVRVRGILHTTEESETTTIGDWSAPKEMIFVKVDKTNFPGMYQVIKNGGVKINFMTGDVEKIIYDKNGDDWLDPAEVAQVYEIATSDISKQVNGKYKLKKATSISGFKGVEYFPRLYNIRVMRYSGKKADLSNCTAKNVELRRHTSKKLTMIAPNAKTIRVIEPLKANPRIDLAKCSSAVSIEVQAENSSKKGTKRLKLPKEKKNLKVLDLCEVHVKSLNLNAYTNLQKLYLYRCNTKKLKVNKCKGLRYLFICQCKKIKSLNLKSNKQIIGADFYQTAGLTKRAVKKSNRGKYTWNKGTWWEETSAYKNWINSL